MNKKSLTTIISIIIICIAVFMVWQYTNNGKIKNQNTVNIGNTLEKKNLISLNSPQPNDIIKSPLLIQGQARGNWFFEGSFPIVLTDQNGTTIANGIAKANGQWMTTEFVPFTATLTFNVPVSVNNGYLILKKDNPSDKRELDDNLDIPISFGK